MGLTISYELRLPARVSERAVLALLERVARRARQLDCVSVSGPLPSTEENQLGYHPFMPERGFLHWAKPDAGAMVIVKLGEGCEPLRLALYRHPREMWSERLDRVVRTGRGPVWRFQSFCKTQYASALGWGHFRQCHVTALDLLGVMRDAGVQVKINDEGGYWPHRSESNLRRNLEEMNGAVAALVGHLKDRAPEGADIQAPILAHPDFERLEAGGLRHWPAS
jgi:hypothetical protein